MGADLSDGRVAMPAGQHFTQFIQAKRACQTNHMTYIPMLCIITWVRVKSRIVSRIKSEQPT